MLLKADKCWIQVHEADTVNYENYFEKLKKMDKDDLAEEVERNRKDLVDRDIEAEVRFALSKYFKVLRTNDLSFETVKKADK